MNTPSTTLPLARTRHRIPIRRDTQRGAATLPVTLLLLLILGGAVAAAHRGLLFEQRSAAQSARAAEAATLADAGLEWARARLNDPTGLDAAGSCTPTVGGPSFRQRWLRPRAAHGSTAASFTLPAADAAPADRLAASCHLDGASALQCRCPADAAVAAPPAVPITQRRFRVEARAVADDPWAVELIGHGCTSVSSACDPDAPGARADAVATARLVVHLRPTLRTQPAAPLVAGGDVAATGALLVSATDPAMAGITVHAGGSVDRRGAMTLQGAPGTPGSATVSQGDAELAAMASADARQFCQRWLGQPCADYAARTATFVVAATDCSAPDQCAALVSRAYDAGFRAFWVEPALRFDASTLPAVGSLGTPEAPVILFARAALDLDGGPGGSLAACGVFAGALDAGDWTHQGTAQVRGAVIARRAFRQASGSLQVTADARITGIAAAPEGVFAMVPGSWRDLSEGAP